MIDGTDWWWPFLLLVGAGWLALASLDPFSKR